MDVCESLQGMREASEMHKVIAKCDSSLSMNQEIVNKPGYPGVSFVSNHASEIEYCSQGPTIAAKSPQL